MNYGDDIRKASATPDQAGYNPRYQRRAACGGKLTQTIIQRAFAPVKSLSPSWLSDWIRRIGTALLTPVLFSYKSGHFRSSLRMSAVSRNGAPLPWYTYPCIDFLKFRDYSGKTVLEFGGGQSTLWWAARAKAVVTFEGQKNWYEKIRASMPANVNLNLVTMDSPEACSAAVSRILAGLPSRNYDVVVVDGLYRYEMIEIAKSVVSDSGIVIVDNADAYAFWKRFTETGMSRVDFYGHAPGVVLPHSTSIFFRPDSFAFSAKYPIPTIAKQG